MDRESASHIADCLYSSCAGSLGTREDWRQSWREQVAVLFSGQVLMTAVVIPEEESEVTDLFSITSFQTCQLSVSPQFRQTVPVCEQDAEPLHQT